MITTHIVLLCGYCKCSLDGGGKEVVITFGWKMYTIMSVHTRCTSLLRTWREIEREKKYKRTDRRRRLL